MENQLIENKNLKDKFDELDAENSENKNVNADLAFENEDLKNQLNNLRIEVEKVKKLKKVFTCIAGNKTKTVTSVNPICPKGYKVKE